MKILHYCIKRIVPLVQPLRSSRRGHQLLHVVAFDSRDEDAGELEAVAKALQAGLTKLRRVRVGGQISPDVLNALLYCAEQVETLALINLIYGPDQREGPGPVLFLQPIQHRFEHLSFLHLSKLAALYEDYTLAGLRWEWDTEQEILLLQE